MRFLLFLLIFLLNTQCKNGNQNSDNQPDTPMPLLVQQRTAEVAPLYQQFYDTYKNYKEPSIKVRRFALHDIEPLLLRLKAPFKVSKVGKSIEGRTIYQVKIGTGKTQVFLWSQMHGDESTATMAIMDLFNFFSKRGDDFDAYRQKILSEMTLTFIPMLNPDGAERFQRRNAIGIDLNRDAMRLQCPESQLLKQVRDELQADWGFNLHDQGRYYVGDKQSKIATFSFLSPAYNVEKEVNEKRGDAMQLIGFMNNILQTYIPKKVGKYDDTFEPRAFGDNFQKRGTRTILIECGLQEGDPEKQEIRHLHYLLFLAAFDAIAAKSYKDTNLDVYHNLPYNKNTGVFDLIVGEAQVQFNGKWYTLDLGFKRDDTWLNKGYAAKPSITEFGDMSVFAGYDEMNAKGYRAISGKVYPSIVQNMAALQALDIIDLLQQGYTDVRLREFPKKKALFPLNLLTSSESANNTIGLNNNPCFVLEKDGVINYAVVNGFGYDLKKDKKLIQQLVKSF